MVNLERSVLIHHDAERMRALVEDVESYPSFLPWCRDASLRSGPDSATIGALTIDFRGVRQTLVTENVAAGTDALRMRLISGPFKSLDGEWQFKSLGPGASKVTLRLHYDFSSRLLQAAIGPVFRHITSTLIEAFVRRADQLYGAPDPGAQADARQQHD